MSLKLFRGSIRTVTFSDPQSHSEPIFKSLNIVKFDGLIKYHILKCVFFWKRELLPACFPNFYNFLREKHTYQNRQELNENMCVTNTNSDKFGERSIQFIGAMLWNQIPY